MTNATISTDGLVRIERKKVSPITVAPLGDRRIDKLIVEAVLAEVLPTAIVLISKSGHYDWDARELAMAKGSTILTVKELYTFMHEADLRPFLDKNVSYNRERLEQHSRIVKCDMICESSLRLRREGSLSDVVIAIEYEYEFSEEATVRAISRHPDADIILNANPNGRATTAAYSHARDARVPIYKISELMGALNYDGDQLRTYTPPKRH
ncbi:hypothetical protein [Streptosporangium sp. NPDC004631]